MAGSAKEADKFLNVDEYSEPPDPVCT